MAGNKVEHSSHFTSLVYLFLPQYIVHLAKSGLNFTLNDNLKAITKFEKLEVLIMWMSKCATLIFFPKKSKTFLVLYP